MGGFFLLSAVVVVLWARFGLTDVRVAYGLDDADAPVPEGTISLDAVDPRAVADDLFNRVVDWARETPLGEGTRVIDEPWVQLNLARVRTGIEALKLVCYKQAWAMTEGTLDMADASAAKVYGSEFFIEVYRLLGEVLGQASLVKAGSQAGQVLQGRLERLYRTASIITFGGGTNEIQRDIISAAGLWMPRAGR